MCFAQGPQRSGAGEARTRCSLGDPLHKAKRNLMRKKKKTWPPGGVVYCGNKKLWRFSRLKPVARIQNNLVAIVTG